MPSFADYVHALAAPADFGGSVRDRESARRVLSTLFQAKNVRDLRRLFDWFRERGYRTEYLSYEAHAGGGWTPDPRDRDLVRKVAFTIEHRKRMKGRGLVALDAMRAAALAGWAVKAGMLEEAEAMAQVAKIVSLAFAKHESWTDLSDQLLLGLGFAEGDVDPALREAVSALEGPPWPTAKLAPAKHEGVKKAPAIVALKLALDCPGCGYPVAFRGIEDASCRRCREALVLAPAEWAGLFAEDVEACREGRHEDPDTRDFGATYLSRRRSESVATVACPCGEDLEVREPGVLVCSCGRPSRVTAADRRARAIADDARLVVASSPRPPDPEAEFTCAACPASQPLGDDPSRVRTCRACGALTFVDDAAHARSFDPPRVPTFHLVLGDA